MLAGAPDPADGSQWQSGFFDKVRVKVKG